ncbi:MAG: hypothetical protein J1F24_03685 [Oscillospiraceae bacterium]|nr:hypothetical protein [Oscillospiraceae bacterium]
MDREEILAKSRAENKNKDVYEQEVLKQAGKTTVKVMILLAGIFMVVQMIVGDSMNWGMWALVFCTRMTESWVIYVKLHQKQELKYAIIYTVLVAIASGYHIYNLISSSTIL